MKKILTIATITFTFLLLSCESTKAQNTEQAFSDEDEVVEVSGDDITASELTDEVSNELSEELSEDEYEEKIPEANISKNQTAKKSFISFGNIEKFILADPMSTFTPNVLNSLKQTGGVITIEPEEKVAGFGSPYLLAYYIVTMDEKNRNYYKQAVNTYLNDFNNKKLDRKSRKSYQQYGKMDVKLWWGPIKSSTPNHSKTKCYLGYTFKENSPYFTLTMYSSVNDYFLEVNSEAEKESINLTYYLTKAQAKALSDFLSADYLNPIFEAYDYTKLGGVPLEADNY